MAKIYNPVSRAMTVLHNGQAYSVDGNHPNHKELLEAFNNNDFDTFVELTQTSAGIKHFVEKDSSGNNTGLEVVGEKVLFNGVELHSTLVDRILGMKKEGFKIDYMLLFLGNLLENPSNRAVEELYDFLTNKNLPITEDGCFLAYKTVKADFTAKHPGCNLTLLQGRLENGSIFNGIGEVIECVRNQVDDERAHECSKGLHVGGLQYSGPNGWYHSPGDKVVIVKINPKDVVSVPRDHNAQKVRVCKYEVIEEYVQALPDFSTGEKMNNPYDYYDDYYTNYEDDYTYDEVDVENLEEGDIITFIYNDEKRHVRVKDNYDPVIHGTLLHNDPNFDPENVSYRNFNKTFMYEVEFA